MLQAMAAQVSGKRSRLSKIMQNIAGNLLTLGITTKGRVDELVETLRLIEASELKSCPIILIDDGGGGQFIEAAEFELDLNIHRYERKPRACSEEE